jgi:RNA polymerase sigma-70 factor, ECF subfamily
MNKEQVKALLEQVRQADISAFHTLFTDFHPTLFRYIYVRCRDYDLAQDIAQETFIRIWQHRGSMNPNRSFWAFLVRIAENLLKDHYRHRRVVEQHQEYSSAVNDSVEHGPEEKVHFQQLQQALLLIVNHYLPPKCRTVFVLSRFEGKCAQEIAEILNISVKTVENS